MHGLQLVALVALMLPFGSIYGQAPKPTPRPRAAIDSIYAAQLAIASLVEAVQRASTESDSWRMGAPSAGIALSDAAAAAARRPANALSHRHGPLWDYSLDSLTFRALGPDELTVTARSWLRTMPESSMTVTLVVRRSAAGIWSVTAVENLDTSLGMIAALLTARLP